MQKNQIRRACQHCGAAYSVKASRAITTKYCSRICGNTAKAINQPPKSEEARRRISLANKGRKRPDLAEYNRTHIRKGRDHHQWKEEGQTYGTMHAQIKRLFSKGGPCELCGSLKHTQLSNKNHAYRFVESEWWILCAKCHYKFDVTHLGRKPLH